MSLAIISIGSNIEDRIKHMSMALVKVAFNGKILALSDIYETDPVECDCKDKFLNAAIALETTVAPQKLLESLMQTEQALGRIREVENGPRTVDLDIIFYDDLAVETENLTIPHPRWAMRDFVTTPLLDLRDKGMFDDAKYERLRLFLSGKTRRFEPYLKV